MVENKKPRTKETEHKHPYYKVIGTLGGQAVKEKYAGLTEEEITRELHVDTPKE